MRICVISDIHGCPLWEKIVEREYDSVEWFVFLGDYMDDKEELTTLKEELENLYRIVEFKEEYRAVDLLIGNHDLQYVGGCPCSNAYNPATYRLASGYLIELIRNRTIQVTAQYGNYLLSHAGVSATWMKENGLNNLSDINQEFALTPLLIDWISKAGADDTGENDYQSPIWIRLHSCLSCAYGEYTQVVGHTRLKDGRIATLAEGNKRLLLTDTGLKEYLIIDTATATEEIKRM